MISIPNQPGPRIHWSVGEAIPAEFTTSRVLTFTADGDELAMVLAAMKRTREPKQHPLAAAATRFEATAKALWRDFFCAALAGVSARAMNTTDDTENTVVKIAADIADAAMHEYLKGNDRA